MRPAQEGRVEMSSFPRTPTAAAVAAAPPEPRAATLFPKVASDDAYRLFAVAVANSLCKTSAATGGR